MSPISLHSRGIDRDNVWGIPADGLSSPGPRKIREHYPDPMLAAAEARRHPSISNLGKHRSPSRLTSGSNPSLESQLAYDFQRHASVAGTGVNPSSSATSLGRHGNSQFSLHDIPPVPPVPHLHGGNEGGGGGRGSAPPSPYGHPAGSAVASGVGMGRHVLPSIQQWEEGAVMNPMFKVVSLAPSHQSSTDSP